MLERVSLCDTVTVRHSVLGITAKAKVIATRYDTLAEKYISIELGSAKANLLQNVSSAQDAAEQAAAKVDRFPALMNTAIAEATGLITGQTGGYVVINTTDAGQPYELLILDAPSIAEAVNVWRWNVGGLGFSHNGYNGPYETAITADGQIVADFITSGTLVANIIKAGVLQSQDGSSYWDLETGEVVLRAYATTESVQEQSDRITEIEVTTPMTVAHYVGAWKGNIYGYLHSMEDHAVARLQMKEKDHFIEGLEFAGAHGMSGDGMGPQITNGRAAAKAVREDLEKKKEAAKK